MAGVNRTMLALIALLAMALRWHEIGQLSLGQFDEGVLVSGAFGVWLHGPWHFPLSQPLQAPPLFPWIIAGAFSVSETPIMGIYVSAALGVATVVIYFALLRRFYGDRLGLAGAALLAASDLHVAFSRMALTDVALTFFFVVGAYLFARLAEFAPTRSTAIGLARRVCWSMAVGAAAGAAWNTKYNGWMLLVVLATTWLAVAGRRWLFPRVSLVARGDEIMSRPSMLLLIVLATAIAIACFAPWYFHVNTTFPGGYSAVTRNHLRYVGGFTDWPERAARLWLSLPAFRHFGWLITLAGSAAAIVWFVVRPAPLTRKRRPSIAALAIGLSALAAIALNGGDAILMLLAAGAIAPALIWGRWPEVFFAVWAGAFLVMTPFYHPYTRLLVPMLPAAIALSLWLVSAAVSNDAPLEPSSLRIRAARLSLLAVVLAALLFGVVSHPFGLVPSRGVWQHWSTRNSYRALADEVLATVPKDGMVLCQGLPAMELYLEREWTPLEAIPFDRLLSRVPPSRPCYLAVDSWGAYAENHELALASLEAHLPCLTSLAVVPNDLNIATLLDYLPPAAVAQRLARPLPLPVVMDSGNRSLTFPAPLKDQRASVIVLYRIDRDCVGKALDNASSDALQ